MIKEILKKRNFRECDTMWNKLVKEAKSKRITVSLLIRHIFDDYFKRKRK